jgi:hypothetical protein
MVKKVDCTAISALAVQLKTAAYAMPSDAENKAFLMAISHYFTSRPQHPAGTTIFDYLPHWVAAQGHRTDIYSVRELNKLRQLFPNPQPMQGKFLKKGYSYVWVDAPGTSIRVDGENI